VRFLLANERTLLAWLRTAIALQAGGLAVLQFATSLEARSFIGVGLLLIGAACGLFGLARYRAADRAIRSDALPDPGRGPIVVTVVVAALGIVLAVAYLLSEIRS
jgi:putative membrane protein